MTIENSQFIFLTAVPGTGKTFTGDYLEAYHDFVHIDGDIPLRRASVPKNRKAIKAMFEHMHKCLAAGFGPNNPPTSEDLKKIDPSMSLMGPHFDIMVDSALDAAKKSDEPKRIVITFACTTNLFREYVVNKLKEAGAKDVVLMCLTIDPNVKAEGLYHRTKQQAKGAGVEFHEMCKLIIEWEADIDPTKEQFIEEALKPGAIGSVHEETPPSYAKVIDVSGRDVTSINNVDDALGLTRSKDIPYDEIVQTLKEIDIKRDQETPYCSEILGEIGKEIEEAMANAKTEEERLSISSRRSSLIEVAVMTRDFTMASIDDDDDTTDEEEKKEASQNMTTTNADVEHIKSRNRRSSLIITGHIEG